MVEWKDTRNNRMVQSHGFGACLHERLLHSFGVTKQKLVTSTSDALPPQLLLQAFGSPPDAVNDSRKSIHSQYGKRVCHGFQNGVFHSHLGFLGMTKFEGNGAQILWLSMEFCTICQMQYTLLLNKRRENKN